MSSVAEFIKTREHIEALATKIALLAERKAAPESKRHLDEAIRHLDTLKTMVANDVQVTVVERLTRHLAGLGTKIDKIMAKRPAAKKQKPEAIK